MTQDRKTRCVGYCRVSTAGQAEDGLSLEVQKEGLRRYADLYGLDIVAFEGDEASAKNLDRPGLTLALGHLKKGWASALLAYKLDRLTRSVADLGELIDEWFGPYQLILVQEHVDTHTAAGRGVLNMMAVIAQWEREATGERTRVVMRHKRARNEYCGGQPPWGWENEKGRLVPCQGEIDITKRAIDLRGKGYTLRAISAILAQEGRMGREGQRLGPKTVQKMVGK